MRPQHQWDRVYSTKAPHEVSWYRPHLDTSLALIERTRAGLSTRIIDVGAGESTLVDDLLKRGYRNLTVLDISQTAIEITKARLGPDADRVTWLVADVTAANLRANAYDIWHDRAVFHFLTNPADRAAYVRQVRNSVVRGGHIIVGTFGLEGPSKCSGLDVQRYDAESLHNEFGTRFHLIDSLEERHLTPIGTIQQFLYCLCVIK